MQRFRNTFMEFYQELKKNIYQVLLTQVKTIPLPSEPGPVTQCSVTLTHSEYDTNQRNVMPGEALTWEG